MVWLVGEMSAEAVTKGAKGGGNGVSTNTAIQLSGLTGGVAAVGLGSLLGEEDEELGRNAWEGSRIGGNAARENATYIDKKGKIMDVDVTDGDKGVYIDNQDGGSRKDAKIGESKYLDTFLVPETGEVGKDSKIHIDSSVDLFVKNISGIGGAKVGGLDTIADLYYLAKDSMAGGPFDVKTKLGAYDGYLLNGQYVTGRDIGNYLAGVNGTKAGVPGVATMFLSGAVQVYDSTKAGDLNAIPRLFIPPYFGEVPYTGRMIQEGINNTNVSQGK